MRKLLIELNKNTMITEIITVEHTEKIVDHILDLRNQVKELKLVNEKQAKQLILYSVSQQSELFSDLLTKLKEENMCSHAGDELINNYFESLNCG